MSGVIPKIRRMPWMDSSNEDLFDDMVNYFSDRYTSPTDADWCEIYREGIAIWNIIFDDDMSGFSIGAEVIGAIAAACVDNTELAISRAIGTTPERLSEIVDKYVYEGAGPVSIHRPLETREMNATTPKITYTMNEAMDALRISRKTIYDLINSGLLRTYKIGSRRYCTPDAIIECQHALEKESN